MSNPESILAQRKLVLTLAFLLAALGFAFWFTMTRQEDPRLPDFWGNVTVTFPGADAETVERLVLEPIEDHLAHVQEIKETVGTANSEIAFVEIDLRDDLSDVDAGWDRVREALEEARLELPEGVSEPVLDDRRQNQESIVYALTGDPDPLRLADAAEELKYRLLAVAGVSEVTLISDPGEQITIELDDAEARRLSLSAAALAAQLGERSRILPGGSVEVAGRDVRLRPLSEFASVDEIRATPVLLPGGDTVPLAAVARVRRGPREPAKSVMRSDGEAAVGVGVIPARDLNLVEWGRRVRERVAEVAPELAPVEVRELIYQPGRVEARLDNLNRSLLTGALVVAGVLVLAMGLRLGLVVASVVPLVSLSSMAVYALGGGVLHQMSIAAVVIALGMLVDNAIVMAEAIQWRLDRGAAPAAAAIESVRELAVPLAGATATTLAAFVPMLLAEGVTAEFTRAIPVVIVLTLAVSYVFAVFVTPALGVMALKPRRGGGAADLFQRLAGRVSRTAVAYPGRVLLAAVLVVAVSFAAFPLVRQDFFPSSDRNQLVVELKLPEGSHLGATDAAASGLERQLLALPEVASVAAYVGRSAPHFYYNLSTVPWSPHFAQLVVETTSLETLQPVIDWVRGHAARELPDAEVVVRKLEQGPPVTAPVEVRLYGRDLAALHAGAEEVMATLREVPGTADVRHDLSQGSPVLRFRVDDAAAARRGLSRVEVAQALYGATRGLPVGQYRAGDDPVPVVVRSAAGEHFPLSELASLDVSPPAGRSGGAEPVPLAQVAQLSADWRPGAIQHRNRRRVARVSSQLVPGVTYAEVTDQLLPRLAELDLPDGVEVEMGGAAESSGEANSAMLRTVPAGILLLLGILMAEFRSFRRVGIVLVTVPLAMAGIVPGLLLGDQPFGFMSLLGLLALAGVVVNNAIVLLEVIEARRGEGATVAQAVADAVERRVRPILLTTATTVLGLLPLAVSPSTLWPPLAWTMISGLIASTLLTLLVVPALYLLLFRPDRVLSLPFAGGGRRAAEAAGLALVVALALASPAAAQAGAEKCLAPGSARSSEKCLAPWESPAGTGDSESLAPWGRAVGGGEVGEAAAVGLTLPQAMQRAAERPLAAAAGRRAAAAGHAAVAQRRAGSLPSVLASAGISQRDRALQLVTPIGSFDFGDRRSESADLTVLQPLLRPAQQLFAAPAARAEAEAAGRVAARVRQEASALAAEAFLDVLAVDAALASTDAFLASLEARLEETEARVEAGRTLEADALKVRLARDDARQDRRALLARRQVAVADLARAVGQGSIAGAAGTPRVEPRWNGAPDLPGPPAFAAALGRALEARPDLAALAGQRRAADLRRRGVQAERWPSLDASASYVWQGGSPYADDAWVEAGLRLTWRPLQAGTRAARGAAWAEEAAALAADLAEARRGVEVELAAAYADLDIARGALEVGESGVRQAAETLRVEVERYAAGRVTTNDLLDAEAALRRQRTRRDVAALDVVRAWVRVWTAMGEDVPGL